MTAVLGSDLPIVATRMTTTASASEQLAEFVAAVRYDHLPRAVQDKVRLHVLDTLGVALAATAEDFAAKARAALRPLAGRGVATVLGEAHGWPAAWAALYNGMLAHGLDYDDTHAEAVLHVSTTVVPAAWATAEEHRISGAEFLAAVAAGMEVNVRIGIAAPGRFHDRGFHPTGICGAYAAAAAAARAAGASAPAIVHAFGLAGSQAAGTLEFLGDGSWSKRMHAGWAAHSGIVAARLGRAGFVGPRGTLEGRFGLYRTHIGEQGWDTSEALAQLGSRWRLLEISLKPYPACHMTHACIDAARVLRSRPGFALAEVEAIEARVHPRVVPVVCEPAHDKVAPRSEYEAKFSLPYTVACMLVRGHVDVHDFTPEAIAEETVLAVAGLVRYQPDPASAYPRYFDGALQIRFRDGRVWEHRQAVNRGHPDYPLDPEEIAHKFRTNATRVLPEQTVDRVVEAVESLPGARSLHSLRRALRMSPRAGA